MWKTQTFHCENCGIEFQSSIAVAKSRVKHGHPARRFCSKQCQGGFRSKQFTSIVSCAQCENPIKRSIGIIKKSKSGRSFCSSSCAAKYNNAHKTHGTRRSKLESYLEQQLRSEFPQLELICNGKDAIGSELDFYFPQLRLAIELNGIFHYEPIYGADKLERIQANDQQKYAACNAVGIELCVIDSSTVDKLTRNVKNRYYSIVKDLVIRLSGRLKSTDVQENN